MPEPSPRSWRRFLAAFFLVNLVLASYFLDTWSTSNPVSRALPALTLVEEGTLKINTYASRSGDKARVGEDYYSDKAPLPTLVMAPVYDAYPLRDDAIDWLREYCVRNDVACADARTYLLGVGEIYWGGMFANPYHPGPEGHMLMGGALAEMFR